MARLLLTCSSWIDLPSPDPLIADASRQVLVQEASYAAWCGAANLVIHGPRFAGNGLSPAGVTAFARAILEVLEVGPAFNVQIILPMSPICDTKSQASSGDLARLPGSVAVKQENGSGEDDDDLDFWASWTAWNSIRSFCKYSPRLAIGKRMNHLIIFSFNLNFVSTRHRMQEHRSLWFDSRHGMARKHASS